MRKRRLSGQSLFEVMFAVAIASIIMMSVVALSKQTVSSSDFSRNNALASRYAQEAVDWVRSERDSDWSAFFTRANANPTFCLEDLNVVGWGGAPPCSNVTGTIFERSVVLTQVDLDSDPGVESVEAEVVVTWDDGKGAHRVSVISRLTNWNI
jgi:Tfp pilus assembly protein PilV